MHTRNPVCTDCGINKLQHARANLGYTVCLTCGERAARARKHTTAPLSKSNYVLIHAQAAQPQEHADLTNTLK